MQQQHDGRLMMHHPTVPIQGSLSTDVLFLDVTAIYPGRF